MSYGNMKDGKLVLMGEGPDRSGKLEGTKMVLEDIKPDSWTSTFYKIKADGTTHMWMRLKYTRKAK